MDLDTLLFYNTYSTFLQLFRLVQGGTTRYFIFYCFIGNIYGWAKYFIVVKDSSDKNHRDVDQLSSLLFNSHR